MGAYLEVLSAHCSHIRDAQDETYCVEDVRLAASIESSDRVEALVPVTISIVRHPLVAIVYHPEMTVRTAYDLKPCSVSVSHEDHRILTGLLTSIMTSTTLIAAIWRLATVELVFPAQVTLSKSKQTCRD